MGISKNHKKSDILYERSFWTSLILSRINGNSTNKVRRKSGWLIILEIEKECYFKKDFTSLCVFRVNVIIITRTSKEELWARNHTNLAKKTLAHYCQNIFLAESIKSAQRRYFLNFWYWKTVKICTKSWGWYKREIYLHSGSTYVSMYHKKIIE